MVTTCSILVIFSVVALLVQADPLEMKKKVQECKDKFSIDEANMMSLMQKGVLIDETNENYRCFVQCCMDKMDKMLDKNDVFDVSKSKKNMAQHSTCLFGPPGTPVPVQSIIDKAVDTCAIVSETGKCMTNYKIFSCLYKQFQNKTT